MYEILYDEQRDNVTTLKTGRPKYQLFRNTARAYLSYKYSCFTMYSKHAIYRISTVSKGKVQLFHHDTLKHIQKKKAIKTLVVTVYLRFFLNVSSELKISTSGISKLYCDTNLKSLECLIRNFLYIDYEISDTQNKYVCENLPLKPTIWIESSRWWVCVQVSLLGYSFKLLLLNLDKLMLIGNMWKCSLLFHKIIIWFYSKFLQQIETGIYFSEIQKLQKILKASLQKRVYLV